MDKYLVYLKLSGQYPVSHTANQAMLSMVKKFGEERDTRIKPENL